LAAEVARTPAAQVRRNGHRRAVVLVVGRLLHPFFPINKNLWTSTFRNFHGRFRNGGAGAVLLGRGSPWLAKVGDAVSGVWNECHCGVCDLRTHREIERGVHVNAGNRQTTWHGYVYTNFFATLAQPKNASLSFCHILRSTLLCPGVAALPRRVFIRV